MDSPRKAFNFFFGNPAQGSPPSMLQIEPTSLCPLSCSYCIQHQGKRRGELHRPETPSGNISLETFVGILDAHPQAFYLQLAGQGEPLLHPRIDRLVTEARSRGVYVFTVTNGMLLSAPMQERLLDSGLDTLAVSVDMASREEMEKNRKGSDYATIEANIRSMIKKRNAGRYPTLIALSSVVFKKDLPRLKEYIRFYDSILRPDIISVSSLASSDPSREDYFHLYEKPLKDQMISSPLNIGHVNGVRALVISSSYSNFGPRKLCVQTGQVYYRFDGSTAYCCIRHKVDTDDPVREMRHAARLMARGETPPGCRACHYLPERFR